VTTPTTATSMSAVRFMPPNLPLPTIDGKSPPRSLQEP
jgi:hypothetical protein